MATVQVTLIPLEEYLRTTYHPDRDWVDGEARERNMGEGQHAVVQKFLAMFFGLREEAWGVLALTEQRVQTSVAHYRIPDVLLMRDSWRFEAIVRTAPLLCVEILSRDDRASEMNEKIDEYLRMGVQAVWIIDPRLRRASIVDARGVSLPVDELVVEGTPIRLAVAELFRQLNRLEGVG